MNLSAPFIQRPVATLLLAVAILLLGALSFRLLPVSPLPQMDFPVITVQANLPGASPQVMASSVATPLERSLGTLAGVNQMTSRSSQGTTRITLQFDMNRDINEAAREVQAAINAARSLLPSTLRTPPTYRKVNPSQAPVMVLSLTAADLNKGQLYDVASTVLAQRLAQVPGVGEVQVGGSSLPAVRIELQPRLLEQYGIALDDIRQTLSNASVRGPKGAVENDTQRWQIASNDQLESAADYVPLIIRYQDGAAIRLGDVAEIKEGVENRYNSGYFNQNDAVLLVINRQAGANILETVANIREQLPLLKSVLPENAHLEVAVDRSPTIRATLHEAEQSLLLAVVLVMLVVGLFLGRWRAALIPALAVPVSLVGSFAAMYLLGFSLNNLSLMALIVATGLVVDDAIVVLENIARHLNQGTPARLAALRGAQEVGFTLLSMNISLVAVFLSILFMGGIVEKLFREFAITLTVAILISLLISLTLTPMLCARWLQAETTQTPQKGRLQRAGDLCLHGYARSLEWALRHRRLMLLSLLATVALNVWLFMNVPKIFMPQQDTGQISGMIRGDDGLSFQAMQPKIEIFRRAVLQDPAVASVAGFAGGNSGVNNAFMVVRLKPIAERDASAQQVVERLRRALPKVPGAQLFLMPEQDLRFGAREGRTADSEFVLLSSELEKLREWLPKVRDALRALPELTGVDAGGGLGTQQVTVQVDRERARQLGLEMSMVTALLNNAFSQRQIATTYTHLNQYSVVMELDSRYTQGPEALEQIHLISKDGQRVPLSSVAHWRYSLEEDRVLHDGAFAAESISFTVAEGFSMDQASAAIHRAMAEIALPKDIIGRLGGTGGAFQQTQSGQPLMILGALLLVYVVLGVLYESYIHPLTILSTLPSAGVGALLAIQLTGGQFSLISQLGLFLLIGVVKKNAILMIDVALHRERHAGESPAQAIRQACLLRFRPILMTTLAAILGALPLLFSSAEGAEMRQPLGVAIVGGLLLSQVLTLYTTPVVYLYLDRLRRRATALETCP